jgi:class 3 adenylate cyclase
MRMLPKITNPIFFTDPTGGSIPPAGSTFSLFPLQIPPLFPPFKSQREEQLEEEITSLKSQLSGIRREAQRKEKATDELIKTYKTTAENLQRHLKLSFVLNRIHEEAKPVFLESAELQEEFLSGKDHDTYVMAVDLRRSTDLMLKSRKPELFAQFITGLCTKLRDIILDEQGVFDKFTGDGILAFFPNFYTGPDAGFRVVSAADRCHQAFVEHYKAHRGSFKTVVKDIGLGIGIDYGEANLVGVGQELAIVGAPVVYGCRMAGTKAGATLVNQPAFEEIFERFSAYCSFAEGEIEVKLEGTLVGHFAKLNGKPYTPEPPKWREYAMTVASPPTPDT